MLTFDALSPRFALLGLGPSWMLMDGVFCQLATFDRTQPEGLALATYLGAVSALANTVVVPAHAAAQRKLRWPTRRWVAWASYAQLASCAALAACWSLAAGGASLALYAAVFVASLAGNGQQLALNPWAAELGQSRRIVEMRAGQESEIPNFKGSYLGQFPLVLANSWTSDHLSERSRSVDAFSGTRARGTLTLKRR